MATKEQKENEEIINSAAKRIVERARNRAGQGWDIFGDEMQTALMCREMVSDVIAAAAYNKDNEVLQTLVAVFARVTEES